MSGEAVQFLQNAGAPDVVHSVTADGDPQVTVPAVGGDYQVVDIAIDPEALNGPRPLKFNLHVSGFGFEIGQHDHSHGMSRKLSHPAISMIPCPAKKSALYSAVTGTFGFALAGNEMVVAVPSFDGPPTAKDFAFADLSKFSIVLGGQVSATLQNIDS